MSVSVTDGKICASNEDFGDATTDASGWLVSTKGGTIRMCAARTPSGPTASGVRGEMCFDSNYIYCCTGTNQWKRVAINSTLWL